MSAVRTRAEERAPAALRQPAAVLATTLRAAEIRTDKPAIPAPNGSIAAIETRLGF